MMIVGLLWSLMAIACFLPMLFIMFGSGVSLFNQALEGGSDASMQDEAIATVFGALGLMLLLFPVYVFLATRLSPCFAMTIKDRKIVFFDAWNVSRTVRGIYFRQHVHVRPAAALQRRACGLCRPS